MKRHASIATGSEARRRLRLEVTGAVQGVGFRPFVHRLAVAEGLAGFVRNTGEGAALEIEGAPPAVGSMRVVIDGAAAPRDTPRTHST
jgi:hydrogenase maturation protein HypF